MTLLDLIEQGGAEGGDAQVASPPSPSATGRKGYAIYATDAREGTEYVSYAEALDEAQALARCEANFDEGYWTGHRVRVIGPAC